MVFYNFCAELCFPKASHCQALPAASSQSYHASTRRKDREQTWTWSAVTLGTFSSLWTFTAPGSPGQDRCLSLAVLKVCIAQFNQFSLLLKTLAFLAESCVTNSTTLPWVYFGGVMAFPIQGLLHSSSIVGCSTSPLPALFQAEERGVREHPALLSTSLQPPSPAPSSSCGRGKDALDLATVSRVPTAELAAPSGGSPDSRPCFSRKIASLSPGRGFWQRAVFR